MQRRRWGDEFGEKVACSRARSQLSWFLLVRRSVGDTASSSPAGPPNIGVKSVKRDTRKSRDRVIAEDNIFVAGVELRKATHKHAHTHHLLGCCL